jgi:hypothetical protein
MAVVGVAVVVVAAVAYFSLTNPGGPVALQTTSSTTSTQSATQSSCSVPAGGNITITETAGQLPCGCVLVDSNSNGSLYVSTSSKVGDNVCITASLNTSSEVYLSVMNSTGNIIFSPPACIAGGYVGGPSRGDTCTAYWDTSQPSPQRNPIEPGVYRVMASDYQGSPVVLEANFTLS